MSYFLSPGQRALLQQLLQMRQHELDRRVALHPGGAGHELEALGAVNEALARVHDAKFGLCIDCGKSIAFERLKLEPWALRCAACEARPRP